MFGKELQVRAHVEIMDSFSAHGDYKEMIDYLRSQQKEKLRSIFLVHGDEDALESFRQKLLDEKYNDVLIPALGESVTI